MDRDRDNVHDDIRYPQSRFVGLRAINVLAGCEWFGRGSSRHALFPSCRCKEPVMPLASAAALEEKGAWMCPHRLLV